MRILAVGATGPLLEALSTSEMVALGRRAHAQVEADGDYLALGSGQGEILRAAIDGILPETDTPGAVEAGVDRFIDVILAKWYSAEEAERFLDGLDELNRSCRDRYGSSFGDAEPAQRVRVLESVDSDHFDEPSHWWGMLKHLTIWGYFTSEVGVTRELAKHTRQGMWRGCVPAPDRGESR